ncbi:DUF3168 domain-containing protein [uncultured Pelagimonas sp.]|uniref:tail completion protein gp17 n=1 Tax=uncultured Pelagimonas sp. TaxID=1618102 RepID=UPI00262469BC|nr:DUF3168 domain-containing protein [uncultured Pelagimonas sp.]
MQEALTALLLAQAPITNLVGTRVHWMRLPKQVKARPYVNLQEVWSSEGYHFRGRSGLTRTSVQADVWAKTYADGVAVTRALTDVLSGYRGTVAGVVFQGIFVRQARDLSGETAGREHQLFRRSVDFDVSWALES